MRVIDERALLKRAQTSAAGFGEFFDAYYDRVYAYAYRRVGSRQLAEDIVANVFEDALKNIRRVRWQGKPLIAWLYRITARRIADYYRQHRYTDSFDELTMIVRDNVGDAMEREEEFVAVRRGLAKLNVRDREIIQLTFFDEVDGATIAAMLGCSRNNVYVRLHRALEKLAKVVNDEIG